MTAEYETTAEERASWEKRADDAGRLSRDFARFYKTRSARAPFAWYRDNADTTHGIDIYHGQVPPGSGWFPLYAEGACLAKANPAPEQEGGG